MAIQTDLSLMQIGDKISCEYVASSGSVGLFSNLGSSTKSLIPVASSATPDGMFYWIFVGYDTLGRKKFIADRNIQHTISWNTLNTAGISSGSGIILENIHNDIKNKLSNPATSLTGVGFSVVFSPDGIYMVAGHNTTPFITIYKRDGDTFTKLPDPSELPANTGYGVAFSPDGTYLVIVNGVTPFITIYKRNGDTFTKLANPSNLPAGTGNGVSFSKDGTYMAVAHYTSPFITIYKRDGDTFTKLPDPVNLPTGNGRGVTFSADGIYLAVAHATTPFITIYKRDGDTFTKLPDPATLPTATGNGVAFSPDGTYLVISNGVTPFITIYKRSGDTFTKLANPATLPTGVGYGVTFSPDGKYMAVAHVTTPFITIYKRNGDTFTKLSDPATLPTATGNGVAFSPDGIYMVVAHNTTPFITIYKSSLFTDNKINCTLRLLTGGIGSTDKDNEWDKIIVESTLNGTITAGDNAVWNWSGGYSWASTSVSNVANRVSRGKDSAGQFNINPSSLANSNYTSFRPVLLVEKINTAPTDNLVIDINSTHSTSVVISGNITDPESNVVSYQILVNGTIIQAWTVGNSLNYSVGASLFNIGDNTLTVDYSDDSGLTSTHSWNVTRTNIVPISSLNSSSITVHNDDLVVSGTITDDNTDQVQYRILIGATVYKDWSTLQNSPLTVYETITHSNFVIGDNTLTINIRDSLGGLGIDWSETITKTNIKPYNTIAVDKTMIYNTGVNLSGTIADTNGDRVKYRITKNSVSGEWTALMTTPVTVDVDYTVNDFNVGENTLLVEILDEFDGDNSINFTIRKKSLDSTYVSSSTPSVNYFSDTVLKISNVFTTLIQMSLDDTQGYLKSAVASLIMNVSGTGSVKVAKIMQSWDSATVTETTLPNIDTVNASVQTISNEGTITLDVSNAGIYGVAIYSEELVLEASYLGNSIDINYQPTELYLPEVIYSNKVKLTWKPVVIPNPESFIKTVLRRSVNNDFSGVTITNDITNMEVIEFEDVTIITGTYYYRLEIEYSNTPTNTVLITNGIDVIAPNSGYRNVLVDSTYITKLTQGLAFDDASTDYNFYTTSDCIKIRPLDMGTVIGGRFSNVFMFEVINTYETNDFQVTLRAYTTDDLASSDNGSSALLPDYETDDGKTLIEISQTFGEDLSLVAEYPLVFNLLAGEKKIVYVRVHPSVYGIIGTRTLKLKLVGNPI